MHHDMFLLPDFLRSSGSHWEVLPQLQAQDLQPDAKIKTRCQLHMVSLCGVYYITRRYVQQQHHAASTMHLVMQTSTMQVA